MNIFETFNIDYRGPFFFDGSIDEFSYHSYSKGRLALIQFQVYH